VVPLQVLHPAQLTSLIVKANTPQQLQQLLLQNKPGHIHLSAALSRLAKMDPAPRKAVDAVLSCVEQLLLPQVAECELRGLSNIAWSCSKLSYTRTQLFTSCVDRFLQQLDASSAPQHISNMLYAVAKSEYALPQQQIQQCVVVLTTSKGQGMLAALCSKLQQVKPQDVSNMLWAVATMGQQVSRQQLQGMLAALCSKLQQAKPQAVSNTLWAVATMGQQVSQQQLQDMLAALCSRQQQAKPQESVQHAVGCGHHGTASATATASGHAGSLVQQAAAGQATRRV